MSGVLYMLPVTLGESPAEYSVPAEVIRITLSLRLFAVEEIRTARRWLRRLDSSFPIDDTLFFPIGKHSGLSAVNELLDRIESGSDAGVMSEAGMPGLADPGAIVVSAAHERGIRVVPLAGPSSVILALAASGLNGQSFAFRGYLPSDRGERRKMIRELERRSSDGTTQVFMETPFRNRKLLEDILEICQPDTRLCIAAEITLPSEYIRTMTVSQWRRQVPDLDKRPAIFLIATGVR